MKHIMLIALSILLIVVINTAAAEIDLSELSFEELLSLQERVNTALWNSSGWNEVSVPSGTYEVGKDIPEGSWIVSAKSDIVGFSIHNVYIKGVLDKTIKDGILIPDMDTGLKVDLYKGQFVKIAGICIFKTYTPSFSFK